MLARTNTVKLSIYFKMSCGGAQAHKTTNCWLLSPLLPLFLFTLDGDPTYVTAAVWREVNRNLQTNPDSKQRHNPEALHHDVRVISLLISFDWHVYCNREADIAHWNKTDLMSFSRVDTCHDEWRRFGQFEHHRYYLIMSITNIFVLEYLPAAFLSIFVLKPTTHIVGKSLDIFYFLCNFDMG